MSASGPSTEPGADQETHDGLIVGLTGGIGSGKSTVAALFARHGAGIVDTDEISHYLTQAGGMAIPAIRTAFGHGCLTAEGALDRAAMRKQVFADAAARKRLEGILHPMIRAQAQVEIGRLRHAPYVIVVVPLLPESPAFRALAQRILVVDCDEATQIARVMARSGMGEAEVRAIIASQTARTERLRLADDIIHNDASLDGLVAQVTALNGRYRQNSN